MSSSKRNRTLLDNLDIRSNPVSCPERSYTGALEVESDGQSAEVLITFLETSGWVSLGEGEDGIRKFAPPLAGYVAHSLRSCVVDANAAHRLVDSVGYRSVKEPLRILDAPGGKVPKGVAVPSPQSITSALARKILGSQDPEMEEVKEEITSWISSVQKMLPEESSSMSLIDQNSSRSQTHRGEILISIDRQTGSLSFVPTGDSMGSEGPYSQRTKVYDPSKRKAPLAVVFNRGLAVRANAIRANPKALEKNLFMTMRAVVAEEIATMTEEDFASSFGPESIKNLSRSATPSVVTAMRALSLASLEARRAKGDSSDVGRRILTAMAAFGEQSVTPSRRAPEKQGVSEITNPLDLLLTTSGEHPWLFPAYSSKEVHKKGVIHLHGISGRMLRGIFKGIGASPDFVIHPSSGEDYNETYRVPFERSIASLAQELDSEEASRSRKALQQARVSIQSSREIGNVGFLELVRGRGVVLDDGKLLGPVQAMGVILGPAKAELGGDDRTLSKISAKIDTLSTRLTDSESNDGIGSIRDFCSRVLKKPEISNELFGETLVNSLREARSSLIRAEKGALGGKETNLGSEKAALQSSVSDCLCFYFFGSSRPESGSRRQLVDRLVAGAANCEFVYFAAQAGAEGLLKIGKAVDVESRMRDLSKEGHEVLPIAYVAVPGIPVGDWTLASAVSAAGMQGGADASKRATTAINRLTGLFGSTDPGGAAEFFLNAVKSTLAAKARKVGGEWAGKKPEDLTEEEVEHLLTESDLMRPSTARSAHSIIRAIHEPAEAVGGVLSKQKRIREASASTLSLLAAESTWTRIPDGGEKKIRDGFYSVDESTQMPTKDEAWVHRVQTGAMVAESTLHQKYKMARVYGEWFHLLPATESIVKDAERAFSARAVRCCAGGGEKAILSVISALQESGTPVCTRTEMLPPSRDGYEEAASRVFGEEYSARVDRGGLGAGGKRSKPKRPTVERASFGD